LDLKLEELAGELLSGHGFTVAVAESCTGGLVGDMLTDVPGSSTYFLGGVLAYHDDLKVGMLGVPRGVISEHGAVSEEVALLMARGIRSATGADFGISTTGIAGPTGGTPAKPVGTVFVGFAGPDVERVERFQWNGDRRENKRRSAQAALQMLVGYLTGDQGSGVRGQNLPATLTPDP
jgi:PncC family amidohydrolase